MMRLLTANIGSIPRIGEHKDQQRYRRGLTHFLNKEISAHAFKDVEQSVIQEAIRDQCEAGLDEITDGLISWDDPISHLCSKLIGIKITGLARYFDTNFYYRKPVISSKPKWKESFLANEFLFARSLSPKALRVVITGPVTLAHHTNGEKKPYDKLAARIQFFTDVIVEEISAVVSKGAYLIQIDEPSILQHPEDFPLLAKAFEQFSQKVKPAQLILAVYFSPIFPILEKLAGLPIESLNLDFSLEGKKLFEKLLQVKPKASIGFGLLNARNTRLEAIDPILNILNQWFEKSQPKLTYLTPSAGLEFLPRDHALAKMKLLTKIKDETQKTRSTSAVQ